MAFWFSITHTYFAKITYWLHMYNIHCRSLESLRMGHIHYQLTSMHKIMKQYFSTTTCPSTPAVELDWKSSHNNLPTRSATGFVRSGPLGTECDAVSPPHCHSFNSCMPWTTVEDCRELYDGSSEIWWSLWNLTDDSSAMLSRLLSNVKIIRPF